MAQINEKLPSVYDFPKFGSQISQGRKCENCQNFYLIEHWEKMIPIEGLTSVLG